MNVCVYLDPDASIIVAEWGSPVMFLAVAVRRRRLARCWLYQCEYVYVEGGAPPSCVCWFTHPIYHGAIHANLPMNQFSYLWGTSL